MTEFKGFVSHIIYRNEENGYTVFEMTLTGTQETAQAGEGPAGGSDTADEKTDKNTQTTAGEDIGDVLTCVGFPVSISEGEGCAVAGDYSTHPVYGEQLRVKSYRTIMPEDAQATYRYLAAGGIKGIGPALAAKIVKKFGDDTFRIMEEEPEKLAQVKGISMRMAREIGAQMEDKKDLRDAMIFLQTYGIGNAYAARIWQAYGTDLYQIMNTNPYRLAEDIRGIGFATADEIARRIGIRADSEYRIRSGLVYTLSLASGDGHSFLPQDVLVQRTCSLLRLPAEEVMIQMENLAVERRLRIRRSSSGGPEGRFSGPSFRADMPGMPPMAEAEPGQFSGPSPSTEMPGLPSMQPIQEASRFDDIPQDNVQDSGMVEVYLASVYRREQEIARMLLDLDAQIRRGISPEGRKKLEGRISRLEKEERITLDPLQRQAVLEAAENAVLVITGGPGTGKTTSLRGILSLFDRLGLRTALTAPTGRAAKRLAEACGAEASTIHRLLETRFDPNSGGLTFAHDQRDPLEADAVILDEASMVDLELMKALLAALPGGCRLVLVGDPHQLPSVGAGNLLSDLLRSETLPTLRLTEIFRQAAASAIIRGARAVDHGKAPVLVNDPAGDFFFLRRPDPAAAVETIVELCARRLPQNMGISADQIQVLTPTRKGLAGTGSLNRLLQGAVNPPDGSKAERTFGQTVYRVGDRVMQVKNNYDVLWESADGREVGMGIFNGDIGRVEEVDAAAGLVTVDFDGHRAVYTGEMLDQLEPAWAITVHKSQGSEYRAVILSVVEAPPMLLTRGVLYTAMTRARELLILVGDDAVVARMAANDRQQRRYSGLRARLVRGREEL